MAFVFPGLGEHYPNMGRGLYEREEGFRRRVDRCAELLLPLLGTDLREVLYPTVLPGEHRGAPATTGVDLAAMLGRRPGTGGGGDRLDRTVFAHPALFAVEYALAGLWMDWGVEPQAVAGYSLGEYVAACVAGVFSLEDALLLVARRAQMIEELPAGAMLAVPLAPAPLRDLLGADLAVAAVNGPQVTVVAGTTTAVAELASRLAAEGFSCRPLRTRHAFHCHLMEPVAERLTQLVAGVARRAPSIPCLSNVTGTWMRRSEVTDPGYWARHLLATVRFADNLAELWNEPGRILLEVGPGQSLASLALQHPASAGSTGSVGPLAIPSLSAAYERQEDQEALLGALGRLWLAGIRVDWRRFYAGEHRLHVALPTYPFERQRYWLDEMEEGAPVPTPEATQPVPSRGGTSLHARPTLANAYVAPETDLEHELAQLWQELLGVEPVGVHDSFFSLGGHSLLATQVISRLVDSLGVELSLEEIFAAPTIVELAGVISAVVPPGSSAKPRLPIPRRSDPGPIPLSYAQQRLWFLDQLEPGLTAYNNPSVMRLTGPLDLRALAAGLDEIVRRHEALRTRFTLRDGQPWQIIQPFTPEPLPRVDLAPLPPSRREAAARRLAAESAQRPFDLTGERPVRIVLLRLAEREHIIVLTLHHIVSDDWSNGVLVRELAALYDAFSVGRPSPLSELAIQYGDFAWWEREVLQGEELDRQLSYWTERLRGAPAALALPTDRPRPAQQTFRGGSEPFAMDLEVTAALQELGRRHGATPFMVLLAAFATLLSRFTGQEDLVVGSSSGKRGRTELGELIGCFINILLLRVRPNAVLPFCSFLEQAREVALGAYAHQDAPFDLLVKALRPERNLAHTPLLQVMLVFLNAPARSIQARELNLDGVGVERRSAQLDLTLYLGETERGLGGYAEYNSDLFDRTTVRRMLRHLATLLAGIAADPERRLDELPLLDDAERHHLLREQNDSAVERRREICLHDLVAEQEERTPDAVAVVFEGASLTWRELVDRASRLSRRLREMGVGPEVPVGLHAERSHELMVGLLGVLQAGGAYLPLDPSYPGERLRFMAEDAALKVVLTQGGLPWAAEGMQVVSLDGSEASWCRGERYAPASAVTPDHPAYVLYTSGSTGRPKGVVNSHRGIVNRLLWMQGAYPLGSDDRVLQKTPFSFDVSVWELFWPLLTGARLVMARPQGHRDGAYLVDLIAREGVTTLHFVPSMLAVFLKEPGLVALPSLRRVIASGEALSRELVSRFLDRLPCELHNLYGPTEAAVDVTAWACRRQPGESPVLLGRPIANAWAYVLDPGMGPVSLGVAGELCIGGIPLARGYLGQPGLTAERFLPDPFAVAPGGRLYRTGDLARYRAGGELEYLGRLDHQVKIRGFRIELGEIEARLDRHPGVRTSLAMARQEEGRVRLVAYVVPEEGTPSSTSEAELCRFLSEMLPEHMVPSAFVFLAALPLLPNGKVDRKALPAPEVAPATPAQTAPETAAERRLAGIWAEVLGLDSVGLHDGFFALGGDSILAMQVVSRAHRAGLHLTPRQIFQHQTLAELAAVAGVAVAASDEAPFSGPVPLTPVQRWFFELEVAERHHWNQSFVLVLREPLDLGWLAPAAERLAEHHAAFSLRFVPREGDWEQVSEGPRGAVRAARVDLFGLPAGRREAALRAAAAQVQASLDLSAGPLLRLVAFDPGDGAPVRLLVTAHHLVVDGVSWRILLEDLETLLRRLPTGGEPALPPRTTSFQRWAVRLSEHARSGGLRGELERWLRAPLLEASRLPRDAGGESPEGANTEASGRTVSVALEVEETRDLQRALGAAHIRVDELILAALVRAFGSWTGVPCLRIDLESHGREDLFADLDLSRTVGWFTSIYPVTLDLRGSGGRAGDSLQAVRAQLRGVAGAGMGGIGYGVLRYLGEDPEIRSRLAVLEPAEVSFNYLGALDHVLPAGSLFAPGGDESGPLRSPGAPRRHLIEVNSGIAEGRLWTSLTYSTSVHRRATVEGLAQELLEELRALLLHGLAAAAGGYTPADFSDELLSESELANIFGQIEEAQSS